MTEDDETAIIARFTQAIEGRYGSLKPARAIARCAGFISELRAEHLPWADIERLFNTALEGKKRPALREGSVSRLYHVAIRHPSRPAPSPVPAISAPTFNVASTPPAGQGAILAGEPAESSVSGAVQQEMPIDSPYALTGPGEAKIDTEPHLRRIVERRAAKRRMEEI